MIPGLLLDGVTAPALHFRVAKRRLDMLEWGRLKSANKPLLLGTEIL